MLSVKTKTSASLENQNTEEQEVAIQAPGTALRVSQEAVGADFQKGGVLQIGTQTLALSLNSCLSFSSVARK